MSAMPTWPAPPRQPFHAAPGLIESVRDGDIDAAEVLLAARVHNVVPGVSYDVVFLDLPGVGTRSFFSDRLHGLTHLGQPVDPRSLVPGQHVTITVATWGLAPKATP